MTGDELRARHAAGWSAYSELRNETIDELAEALDDRDRLEWLQSSGNTQLTLGWHSFEAAAENREAVWIVGKTGDDPAFKGWGDTIRAAIDAARKETPCPKP